MSLVLPGAGQVYGGRRRRGAAMLAAAVAIALVVVALAGRGTVDLLGDVARTDVLLWLLAANAALFAFRAGAVADAWRLGPRPGGRAVRAGLLGVLLALVAVPHALAAWYGEEAYRAITTIFPGHDPRDVALPYDVARAADDPFNGLAIPAALRLSPAPARPPAPAWPRGGRLTVLLLGGDAGPGRTGLRTDTMVVATLDARTRRGALLSLPRNLAGVPLPPSARDLVPDGRFPDILNALYEWAEAHPDRFPGGRDPGATALKQVAANLTGLRVDYYALVDFRGFVDMVDALGGVTVDVTRPVLDRVSPPDEGGDWIRIDLRPGRQHLDAREAFAYVRARSQTSDYDRIRRQRCVLAALASDARPAALLRAFPRLAGAARRNVRTDIPRRVLPDLIRLVAGLDARRIVSLGFTPPAYTSGWIGPGYPVPDIPAIRAAVRRVTAPRGAAAAGRSLGGETCG